MSKKSKSDRLSRELSRSEINLVSARATMSDDTGSYSRNARQGGYAKQRSKRTTKRRVLIGITVTLGALLIAGVSTAFGLIAYLNNTLSGDLDIGSLDPVTVDRAAPEDPFWMLLAGTDWDETGGDTYRADVIILAHIDPGNKKAALVSIPRDTMYTLPGQGVMKINATYTYGELDPESSGAAYLIDAVSDFTGANITYYAQVDFAGFENVVEALGGVTVEVPFDIIGDREAGPVDVYAGEQTLNGQEALVFARSRKLYEDGDFQRQANQRTLLQAIASQTLSKDVGTITNTVTQIAEMTTTNMDIVEIADIALSLRGMGEGDIYTYSLISELDMFDGISYVVADQAEAKALISQINEGSYPDYSAESYQGTTADRYHASGTATDNLEGTVSNVETTMYSVSVRNGYGIAGSATAVSDMLALAGYQQLEIANANSLVYEETLIIYRDDTDKEAAEDIRARLGYGRVIPSLGRYSFEGNILVVVGADFKG